MLEAAQRAISLTEGRTAEALKTDEMRVLAVTHLIEILGEASKGVSEQLKAGTPEIPWAQMAATRDRLIHGYFSVDVDIIWEIVSHDLPSEVVSLKAKLGQD